jgi:hypothetical protein
MSREERSEGIQHLGELGSRSVREREAVVRVLEELVWRAR